MGLLTVVSAHNKARKLIAVAAVAVTTATAVTVSAVAEPRHAPARTSAHVSYTARGATHIRKPNTSIVFAPSKFAAVLHQNGRLSGSLPIPPSSTSFQVIGLLPVVATVSLAQVGAVTGKLHAGAITTVNAHARYYLQLSDVTVAGQAADVGDSCHTRKPLVINVATPRHRQFNLTAGGVLRGRYAIGNLTNCGLLTSLINQLVAGTHNTIALRLSEGHIS